MNFPLLIISQCSGAEVGTSWSASATDAGSNGADCHIAIQCGSSSFASWDLSDGQSSSTSFTIGGASSCDLQFNVQNNNFLDDTVCNFKLVQTS